MMKKDTIKCLRSMWQNAPRFLTNKTKSPPVLLKTQNTHPKPPYAVSFRLINKLKKYRKVKSITIERTEQLLIPIIRANNALTLDNAHWAYQVPFGFNDALDLKYLKRARKIPDLDDNGKQRINEKGKPATKDYYYAAWTQGCFINFKETDFFQSNNNAPDLQISAAKPMSFNDKTGVMNEGSVTYQHFIKRGTGEFFTVTQIEFLQLLIHGEST
jgi:hypothetical protein